MSKRVKPRAKPARVRGPLRKKELVVEKQTVVIKPAKGRPMLDWVGKRALGEVTAFPAQKTEIFSPPHPPLTATGSLSSTWPSDYPEQGLIFHGDNKDVLANLLAHGFRGKIRAIYIDPPFDSGADYIRKVSLRGIPGTAKVEGEEYTLGEQIQYTDIWMNDNYLQFIYERLLLMKELLADDGNIFVQADDKRGHYIKVLLDEVMGPDNYVNDIIWHKGREGGGGTEKNPPLPTEYQNIYLYAYDKKNRWWNPPRGPYKLSTLQSLERDENGWYYMRGRMGRKPAPWEVEAGVSKKTYVSKDPNESREDLVKRLTGPEAQYVLVGDVWNSDIIKSSTETDYPTEKPEALLRLVIQASTQPGDIILDVFGGSGTTAAVAQKMGRRWIVADINNGSIQTMNKRLQKVLREQIENLNKRALVQKLVPDGQNVVDPAYSSFAIYRVNDYDLHIQQNEAMNLAIEHIGITRTKSDSFFQGTLGKRLVRIIPFEHPLGPLDLEEVKQELSARKEEDRDIVVVCLGKQLSVNPWLEDWNRLRKKGDVPNKIEIIELRTDPKYGKFFIHQPPKAKVRFSRGTKSIVVTIEDFVSPSVIERLNQQAGVVRPRITDWRSMVDAVMIDDHYDGEAFNVTLSDIPEKKSDLVAGKYEIVVKGAGKTTVAIKIIDMLGEELLVKEEV